MNDVAHLIVQVKMGDLAAYEPIVHRFQNIAVGYGYAILGDWQLAEDAAQEAFITAYLELSSLNNGRAFPGWFRQILIKHIDRIRRKQRNVVALDALSNMADRRAPLTDLVEQEVTHAALITAIQALPLAQREVVTLFYIDEYSHHDIGLFLDIPVSTVKMRLYHARHALQRRLIALIETELPHRRPSRNPTFMEKIVSYQIATKAAPAQQVISLTRDSYISDLQAHLDGGIKTLTIYAQARGAQVAGSPLAIYRGPVREDQHAPVEICLPVTGTLPSTIEIAVKELPPANVAYTVITMRQSIYPGALKAYEAIDNWIKSERHTATDGARETYLNFNTSIFSPTASLDDPCLEIAWPYQ